MFLKKIAGRNRVVLTATDTASQQFETVFPEYFTKAFEDDAADIAALRRALVPGRNA